MDGIVLHAVQTIDGQTPESRDSNMTDCYFAILKSMKEKLQRANRHVFLPTALSLLLVLCRSRTLDHYMFNPHCRYYGAKYL